MSCALHDDAEVQPTIYGQILQRAPWRRGCLREDEWFIQEVLQCDIALVAQVMAGWRNDPDVALGVARDAPSGSSIGPYSTARSRRPRFISLKSESFRPTSTRTVTWG